MRTLGFHLVLAGLALGGCRPRAAAAPSASASQPKAQQAVARPPTGARSAAVAVRIAAKGGNARVYRLPALTEIPNVVRTKLPPVDRVVGLDAEAEFVYALTAKREMLALDVGSGRVDTVATDVVQATLGPDGTLYTVDSKRRVVSVSRRVRVAWPQPLPAVPREMFGATDQRLVAIDPPKLMTAAVDQPATTRSIPIVGDVAATRWGDLLALASDSGVLLMDPLGRREPAFVPLTDHPRALAFSPSGHRIYVARRTELGLAAIDRYDREEIDGIALPMPAAAIRLDPLGRWLLARPTMGDSAWVVDLPVKRLVGAVAAGWAADLPAIAPDGSLLVRQGADVVAYRPDSLVAAGRVTGGAADLWTLTAWLPRGEYRGAFAEAGTPAAQTPAEAAASGAPLYVQVSTSQNEAWSSEMAQQLTRAGLAAHVLQPTGPDDGYRVVLGPYATREQADAIGRKLGRPFWIYQPAAPTTPPNP